MQTKHENVEQSTAIFFKAEPFRVNFYYTK